MTLRDFFDQVRDLSPDIPICVGETDEAAVMNVVAVEVIHDAKRRSEATDGVEAIELGVGEDTVIVLRW
jgi:hypothetical protein